MDIFIENFRSFGEGQRFELKPVTVLVGKNSSGKSSFLASIKYLVDMFYARGGGASFNADPFFLGGFKSISHYRGRRGAKQFRLAFTERSVRPQTIVSQPSLPFPDIPLAQAADLSVAVTFREAGPEAGLQRLELVYQSMKVTLEVGDHDGATTITVWERGVQLLAEALPEEIGVSPFIKSSMELEYYLRALFFETRTLNLDGESLDLRKRAERVVRTCSSAMLGLSRIRRQSKTIAPIRTRPARSYDPTQMGQAVTADGDDLLVRLGRAKRAGGPAWEKLKAELSAYGKASGLFDAIDVRPLGKYESDPFQILVTIDGQTVNISDVGYGVSQLLPIFMLLVGGNRRDFYLLQQPEVHLHPEAQAGFASLIAGEIAHKRIGLCVLETHSDYIIDRLRQHVRGGDLKAADVGVIFFEKEGYDTIGHQLSIDDSGDITDAPSSYRSFFINEQLKGLGLDVRDT